MAKAGQIIQGSKTKIVFRETSEDTHGQRLTFEQFVQPGTPATPEHLHPGQAEHFEVVSGSMGVRVNGVEKTLGAGEAVSVPPGTPHAMCNAGTGLLHQVIRLEPAGRSETFFETVVGLERDGMLPEGRPTLKQLLQFSLIASYYDNPLAAIPLGPQRVLFTVLGVAARFLGFSTWYEEYSPYGPVTLREEPSTRKEYRHVR